MKYILNSAVITAYGTWEYRPATVDEAALWLRANEWVSTVRYKETAEVIRELTGVEIPLRDEVVMMKPGDEALVFRLRFEKGAGRVAPELKGKLTPDFVKNFLEIGFLKMVSATWKGR